MSKGKSAQEVAAELEATLDALHASRADDLRARKEAANARLAETAAAVEADAAAATAAVEEADDENLDPYDDSDYDDDGDESGSEPALKQSAHISLLGSQLGCSDDAVGQGQYTVQEDSESDTDDE